MWRFLRHSCASLLFGCLSLLVLLGIGSAVLPHLERSLTADSVEYITLAHNLVENGVFSSDPDGHTPELHRTPGYPLFVALFQPWRGRGALRSLLIAQILLTALSCLLLSRTASELEPGNRRTPWMAPALLLLNPVAVLLGFRVLSESLFVFLCTLAAWLLVVGVNRRHLWAVMAAGLVTGSSILVRPIGLVLLPPTLALLGLCAIQRSHRLGRPGREACRRSSALLWGLGALLLPALWCVHNGCSHGFWGVSRTPASFVCSACWEIRPTGETLTEQEPSDPHESAQDSLGGIGATSVWQPGSFPRTFGANLARVLFGSGEWTLRRGILGSPGGRPGMGPAPSVRIMDTGHGLSFTPQKADGPLAESSGSQRATPVWLLMLWSWAITCITYLLAVAGLLRGLRKRDPMVVLWFLLACVLMLGAAGWQANARFRVPALPYLALLAASAFSPPPNACRLRPTGKPEETAHGDRRD